MGEATPWIITAVLSFTGIVMAVLNATATISANRSVHGLKAGRLSVTDVRVDPSVNSISFRVENVGGSDLFGAVASARFASAGARAEFRSPAIERLVPGTAVRLEAALEGEPSRRRALRRLVTGRRRVVHAELELRYLDHSDAVRVETRTFEVDDDARLRGFSVRRGWTTFG